MIYWKKYDAADHSQLDDHRYCVWSDALPLKGYGRSLSEARNEHIRLVIEHIEVLDQALLELRRQRTNEESSKLMIDSSHACIQKVDAKETQQSQVKHETPTATPPILPVEHSFAQWEEDCQGRHFYVYHTRLTCSDGEQVEATGTSSCEARAGALAYKKQHEEFIAMPDDQKLYTLINGDLGDTDKKEAIRLLAKMLLKATEPTFRPSLHFDQALLPGRMSMLCRHSWIVRSLRATVC